jgi:hypothetical protein
VNNKRVKPGPRQQIRIGRATRPAVSEAAPAPGLTGGGR